MIVVSTILIIGGFILYTVLSHGKEMWDQLAQTLEAQQSLLLQNQEMEGLAKRDGLTGLYNQRSFQERLDEELRKWKHEKDQLFLAVMDIDNFKQVNDTYYHQIGDQVLNWVATTLQSLQRVDDFPARYGGEEFVLILKRSTPDEAFEQVELFRKMIAAQSHAAMNDNIVTVSIGLCAYRRQGLSKEELFAGADAALYEAKHSGKNKVVVWQEKEK
ncbi:GGDEF domain-containing protein [Brevibacillus migulae]|uniref:GGDEF domain-containing protein n=1 Tax=Brevibacillus migulae TaxID=1644114 RepID=UPI00106DD628|nr:GGDEF domain-containing protein [Brevibacillus migulae]